jgi:hypothetical protein
MLQGHTVDVLPWDVSLAYVFGLKWDPAPIFQTFAAYTPYLDELNARHYLDQASPDFVLYAPLAMDGRYHLFDEPLALTALTCNYKLVGEDAQFLLLQRRPLSPCGNLGIISTQEATFGREIQVPFSKDKPVIARVYLETSWLGKISGLVYKIPKVMINLEFANGQSGNYTLVVATARDGLPLRPGFLSDSIPISSVERMTFFTNGPAYYMPVIRVDFYNLERGDVGYPHTGKDVLPQCQCLIMGEQGSNISANQHHARIMAKHFIC